MEIGITGDIIKIKETESGHMVINLTKTPDEDKEELMHEVLMVQNDDELDETKVKKIHSTRRGELSLAPYSYRTEFLQARIL